MIKAFRRESGFSVIETLLIVAALAIVGFTGYFVYHAQQSTDKTLHNTNKAGQSTAILKAPTTTDFATCKQAVGSKLLETYPEQCVTKSGKTFTDTTQPEYLVIKEWSVKMPLTANITDATYATVSGASDAVFVSLKRLDGTGCAADAGSLGVINRFTATETDQNNGKSMLSEFPTAAHVGSYYYVYHIPQAYCDPGQVKLPDFSFSHEFGQAVDNMQAN